MAGLTAWSGLARSLWVYRASPRHHRGLVSLYGEFAGPDDLVFDVGAHAGDRVRAFRALGARVVAVEPQPLMLRALRWLHGRDDQVTLVSAALGAVEGEGVLRLNTANPTVATLSQDFIDAADGASGWEGQVWDDDAPVQITTLDALIASHGPPSFIKIDAEGYEAQILAGLTHPSPALSFEFTTIGREAGLAALDHAERLGYRRYRLSIGESHAWDGGWIPAAMMRDRLRTAPHAMNSADIYCRLE